jgi:hypothetical protein
MREFYEVYTEHGSTVIVATSTYVDRAGSLTFYYRRLFWNNKVLVFAPGVWKSYHSLAAYDRTGDTPRGISENQIARLVHPSRPK